MPERDEETCAFGVACSAGKKVLGGGGAGGWVNLTQNARNASVVDSGPDVLNGQYRWTATIKKADGAFFLEGESVFLVLSAICATAN